MAHLEDLRRIAETLPEAAVGENGQGQLHVTFRGKGLAWTWLERVEPKRARVPNTDVLAVRTPSEEQKHELIAEAPEVFFTEPHYDGYPAVLVRLDAIDPDELRELVTDAWRLRAPKRLQKEAGL